MSDKKKTDLTLYEELRVAISRGHEQEDLAGASESIPRVQS